MITMNESVQYIPPEEGLGKISRLLRKNGYLLAWDDFKKDNPKELPDLASFLLSCYLKSAQKLGFQNIKKTEIAKNVLGTLNYGEEVFCGYINPVLDCLLSTIQVYIRPLYRLFLLLLKIKIRKKRFARLSGTISVRLSEKDLKNTCTIR